MSIRHRPLYCTTCPEDDEAAVELIPRPSIKRGVVVQPDHRKASPDPTRPRCLTGQLSAGPSKPAAAPARKSSAARTLSPASAEAPPGRGGSSEREKGKAPSTTASRGTAPSPAQSKSARSGLLASGVELKRTLSASKSPRSGPGSEPRETVPGPPATRGQVVLSSGSRQSSLLSVELIDSREATPSKSQAVRGSVSRQSSLLSVEAKVEALPSPLAAKPQVVPSSGPRHSDVPSVEPTPAPASQPQERRSRERSPTEPEPRPASWSAPTTPVRPPSLRSAFRYFRRALTEEEMADRRAAQSRTTVFSFVTSAEEARMSYVAMKTNLALAFRRHSWFEQGDMLETMEKGVLYPVIHWTELPGWKGAQHATLLDSKALGEDFTLQQGCYTEVKHFRPDGRTSVPGSSKANKAYIFLGFKSLDNTFDEVLEDNWKDWTGGRLIYMNLADEFGLSRMSFYRRIAPRDIDVFMYILQVECSTVTARNKLWLLDFVQRLRVERMFGYLSVYVRSDQASASIPALNGMLNGKVDI